MTVRTRMTATHAAHQAIARLRVASGTLVMFAQLADGSAGDTPMCYRNGAFAVGDNDVLMGVIDGCPFYIDARLDEAWGRSELLLDVADGEPEGPSLSAGPGRHFITTSAICAQPSPGEASWTRP